MKLRFWQKPKWIETPAQTLVVPAGKYTVSYTVATNGKQVNSSTTVYPTVLLPYTQQLTRSNPMPNKKIDEIIKDLREENSNSGWQEYCDELNVQLEQLIADERQALAELMGVDNG